jgi:nitroreductase
MFQIWEETMAERTLFERRFSCRSFADTPLDRNAITPLLDAGRWAPSGGNLQPWRFVVVRDRALREQLARAAYKQDFLAQAPVVIAVCAVPGESARIYGDRGRDLYCLQDTAAAAENLLLAAADAGLGGCWVGAFDETRVAGLLPLATGWRPVAILALGYPAEEEPQRSRRPIDEIVLWLD